MGANGIEAAVAVKKAVEWIREEANTLIGAGNVRMHLPADGLHNWRVVDDFDSGKYMYDKEFNLQIGPMLDSLERQVSKAITINVQLINFLIFR